MVKIGINGFGRIGRLILRALLENYEGKIQVVAINDLGSIEANAHLIKYDSTHGTLNQSVKTTSDGFQIGDQDIKVFAERNPEKLPWGKLGVDVVLECTGFFLDKNSAGKHIQAGAKKVIISAPAKEVGFDQKTKKTVVRIDPGYFRPTEINELRGDAKKAKRELKWKPKTTFKSMVKEMVLEDIKRQSIFPV